MSLKYGLDLALGVVGLGVSGNGFGETRGGSMVMGDSEMSL
jgi:hypothetical protein